MWQQWTQCRITGNNIIIFFPIIFDTTIMGSIIRLLYSSLTDTWSNNSGTSSGYVWSSNITLRQSLEIGDWTTWGWSFIHAYRLHLICSFIFECHFGFFLVHRLVPTFMVLRIDFAAPIRCFAVFFLTSNMLVKRHSDFLALGFLTDDDVIATLVLLSVTPSLVDTIAESRIYLRYCWSSHLPACWYIFSCCSYICVQNNTCCIIIGQYQ